MPSRLIILLLIIAGIILLLRWFSRAQPATVVRHIRRSGLYLGIGLLIFLALTGRLHWIFALFAALIPFVRRLLPLIRYIPLLGALLARYKARQGQRTNSGGSSHVETRFLRMALDHDSGVMSGEILQGLYQGKQLADLSLDQLITLFSSYLQQDPQSATLLETYLDRIHGEDWRDHAKATGSANDHSTTSPDSKMTRSEALEILDLGPSPNEQEIIDAHRRLMQKLHPDRGGSTYLAAKINQAKDLLLEDSGTH